MIPRQHGDSPAPGDSTPKGGPHPHNPDMWLASSRDGAEIPGSGNTSEEPYCLAKRQGFVCSRSIGHPGRHFANSSLGYTAAAWPGAHEPTGADLTDPAPEPSTPAGNWVTTLIPATWWIATDLDDDPAVLAPRVAVGCLPEVQLHRADVTAELWAVFARALPDRGECAMCTATPCADHGGSA